MAQLTRFLHVEALEERALPSFVVPQSSGRRDLAYDDARGVLYITTAANGLLRYNTATGTYLTSSATNAGQLNGVAISPDGKSVYAAVNSLTRLAKVDLATNATSLLSFSGGAGSNGAYDIAFGSSGLGIVTSRRNGNAAGAVDVDQINPATDIISKRADIAAVGQDTTLVAAPNGSQISLMEPFDATQTFAGRQYFYDAAANSFSIVGGGGANRAVAFSRDGTRFAVEQGSGLSVVDIATKLTVENFNDLNGGVAFDRVRNVLYAVDSVADQLVAIDTNTFAEKYRLPIGEDVPAFQTFGSGNMVATADGQRLFLSTPTGVRGIDLPQPSFAPGLLSITRAYPALVQAGVPASITLAVKDAAGNVLTGFTGTVNITVSGQVPGLPSSYTFSPLDQGVKTFTFAFPSAGLQSIVFQEPVNSLTVAQRAVRVNAAGTLANAIPFSQAVTGLSYDAATNSVVVAGARGNVTQFNLFTQSLTAESKLGTTLGGIDTTPDGRSVFAADSFVGYTGGLARRLDVATGATLGYLGVNAFDLAIVAPGSVLLSNGQTLDPATGALAAGPVSGNLARSLDRSAVLGVGGGVSLFTPGNGGTVTASAGGIGLSSPAVSSNGFRSAVNVAGSQNSLSINDANLKAVEILKGGLVGSVYSNDGSILFGVDVANAQVVALDAFTFRERYRVDIGEAVTAGTLLAVTPDTRLMFASTPTGIRELALPVADGKLARLEFTTEFPTIATQGTVAAVTVTARDATGATLTGYTGTVRLTSSDPGAALPPTTTFTAADQGVRTFVVRLSATGRQNITASDPLAGVTGIQSNITVNAFGAVPLLAVPLRRDLAYDPTRNELLISTSDGFLDRFNVATQTMLPAIKVGADLRGLDVSRDGQYAFLAESLRGATQGFVRRVDLNTGVVTDLPYNVSAYRSGLWDVNTTSANYALATGRDGDLLHPQVGQTFQVNAASGAVTVSGALGPVAPDVNMARSADGKFVFYTSNTTLQPDLVTPVPSVFGIYDVAAGGVAASFAPGESTANYLLAANRNGTLFATNRNGVSIYDATLSLVQNFATAAGGVAFDPLRDLLYIADTATGRLETYNSNTFQLLATRPLGENLGGVAPFGSGVITLSGDGRYLFLSTPMGVRQYDLFGTRGAITVTGLPANAVAGDTVTAVVTATLNGATDKAFTGLVRVTSDDLRATVPGDLVFTAADQGVKLVTFTFRTAGTDRVTAGNPALVIASATAAIRVAPAAATFYVLSNFPAGVNPGDPQPLTITARDPFNNLATNYLGTAVVATTDPAVPAFTVDFGATDRGARTVTLALQTPGVRSIGVADVANPALSGRQDGVVVNTPPEVPPPPPPPPPPPVIPPPPPPPVTIPPIVPPPPPPPGVPPPTPPAPPLNGVGDVFAVGTDFGTLNRAFVFDQGGNRIDTIQPYEPGFFGGVRLAVARGPDDQRFVVTGPGPGRFSDINTFDARTGVELATFQAFESTFTGGVFVSTGDILREGYDAIAVSPDQGGGPRVQLRSGRTGEVFADFFGIDDPNFRGGARTAIADMNGDGVPDLIVAAGFGGGPRVAIWDGTTLGLGLTPARLVPDFFVSDPNLRNGVYLAAGDITGDGKAELAVGAGPGGGPRVQILAFDFQAANPVTILADFFDGDPNARGGARVVLKNLDGDAQADLLAGDGPAGTASPITGNKVRLFLGAVLATGNPTSATVGFDDLNGYTGGVFVG